MVPCVLAFLCTFVLWAPRAEDCVAFKMSEQTSSSAPGPPTNERRTGLKVKADAPPNAEDERRRLRQC